MRSILAAMAAMFCMACGGGAERSAEAPAAAPVDDRASAASEAPAAAPSDERPGSHGCGQCKVIVCLDAADPRKVQRVELALDGTLGADTKVQRALLELTPPKGTAEGLQIDVSQWKAGAPVKATLDKPTLDMATEGWKGTEATLALWWGDAKTGERITVPTDAHVCP